MIYTQKIQEAINFAIKTHEIYQKQKRKGKDIPYITHPLTVGLILATAHASEDVVIAGILHDTIEDSIEVKKPMVPKEIKRRFGKEVLDLVVSVTEKNKNLSWEERKTEALKYIESFSNDSVLLKSADILSNVTEIYSDYKDEGEKVFERFKAGKEKTLKNYKNVTRALISRWDKNPLMGDLKNLLKLFSKI